MIPTRYRGEKDKLTQKLVPEVIVISNEYTDAEKKIIENPRGTGGFDYLSTCGGRKCAVGDTVRPFLLAMDRYPKEVDSIKEEMFKVLRSNFTPTALPAIPPGIGANTFGYNLNRGIDAFSQTLKLAKEKEEKCVADALVAEAYQKELKEAWAECGEYRRIGLRWYIVKDGEVFDIADIVKDAKIMNNLRMEGRVHGVSMKKRAVVEESTPITSADNSAALGLTPYDVSRLRGIKCFSSVVEAEDHWAPIMKAREDAEIEAEARRRIAIEAKETAKAVREAKIQAAMKRMR